LCDILLNSTFESSELERERKVILQEIAMVEETPEEIAHDLYFECVYGRSGLGKSILGSLNRIKRLRRSDILKFFREHYRPDQVVFAVSGNVSHAEVVRRLRRMGRGLWQGRRASERKRISELLSLRKWCGTPGGTNVVS
ncbi:MAG: insulinase family protein, partial [Proteobacteria bacterium]|nr:insulinase family protein [Pseudomonadota bacterium]